MKNKIYVVTSGRYSDYHIDGVFDNEKLAQGFIVAFANNTDMNVEEWTLNPFKPEIKKGLKAFFVRMAKDGRTMDVAMEDSTYGFRGGLPMSLLNYDVEDNMISYCWAEDEQHAIKITNEKRIMALAENTWGRINEEYP